MDTDAKRLLDSLGLRNFEYHSISLEQAALEAPSFWPLLLAVNRNLWETWREVEAPGDYVVFNDPGLARPSTLGFETVPALDPEGGNPGDEIPTASAAWPMLNSVNNPPPQAEGEGFEPMPPRPAV